MPFIPISEASTGGFTPIAEAAPERSLPEKVGRAASLSARAGLRAATSIPDAFVGAPLAAIVNLVNSGIGKVTGREMPQYEAPSWGKKIADAFGLSAPETPKERVVEDVASGMGGGAAMAKTGAVIADKAVTPLVQRIGESLAARAGTQVVGGGTGGAAAGVVREKGGGPVAQMAAGMAGGMVPAVPALAAAATRAAVRGGAAGRARMQDNIDTFEDAGAGTPTVGQATETRGNRALESVLSKAPGGAGPMAAKAEAEAAGLGASVENMATTLSPRTGAAPAGRQIASGIKQFIDDFKGSSGTLYDALDKHIPKDSTVDVSNTRTALEKLNADIPGAPNLSKWFKNAKIQGIEGALDKDAPATQAQPIISQILGPEGEQIITGQTAGKAAGLPYEALKKLRTLVGNEMSDSGFGSDVPRSKWKPLYAALSKDMASAARDAGPGAEAAFVRANNYHRAGMKRLEDVLDPITKKGDPEDIFKAAVSGSKEGATTIAGVMKSLPDESRKVVAGTMLRRLGVATAGKQDATGEAFSTDTFLTNWSKLHPDSKRVLFAPLAPTMRSDLDQIAKVASNVREGSKVFANPSGTAQALTNRDTVGGAVLALLTGHPGIAAGIAGTVASANLGARVMTNPAVVHWLAESTKVPVEQLPAQLNQLFRASLYMKGEERRETRDLIKELRAARTAAAQPTQQAEAAVQ